ncbi:putative methyltransferase-domain-containing protein [Tuber indicum]|nr:putative methyltransferase-domain-containing protein [Tuber indicum]
MTRVRKKTKKTGSILLSRHRGLRGGGPSVKASRVFSNTSSLSSKVGRTLIRSHHTLQKRLSQALSKNDTETANSIRAEIEANGGIERYQQASVCGQDNQRGGDSSKVLIDWLRETIRSSPNKKVTNKKLRLLEVGALSPDNACSRSSLFDVTRIDLNSRDPSIEAQDFMDRPIPTTDEERFDIISLSLVLNYVSLPAARGGMLGRTTEFLRHTSLEGEEGKGQESRLTELFPSLFLVLPAPCVTNSRYLDEKRLEEMMGNLGYRLARRKLSAKLIYQLWRHVGKAQSSGRQKEFNRKEEVNPGRTRNNFAILFR